VPDSKSESNIQCKDQLGQNVIKRKWLGGGGGRMGCCGWGPSVGKWTRLTGLSRGCVGSLRLSPTPCNYESFLSSELQHQRKC
jgi:hypothetical protein